MDALGFFFYLMAVPFLFSTLFMHAYGARKKKPATVTSLRSTACRCPTLMNDQEIKIYLNSEIAL